MSTAEAPTTDPLESLRNKNRARRPPRREGDGAPLAIATPTVDAPASDAAAASAAQPPHAQVPEIAEVTAPEVTAPEVTAPEVTAPEVTADAVAERIPPHLRSMLPAAADEREDAALERIRQLDINPELRLVAGSHKWRKEIVVEADDIVERLRVEYGIRTNRSELSEVALMMLPGDPRLVAAAILELGRKAMRPQPGRPEARLRS